MYTQFTHGQNSTSAGLSGTLLLRQSGSVCTFYLKNMISRTTRHESYWVLRRQRKDVQPARKGDTQSKVYRSDPPCPREMKVNENGNNIWPCSRNYV
jgi:hypothetical protein